MAAVGRRARFPSRRSTPAPAPRRRSSAACRRARCAQAVGQALLHRPVRAPQHGQVADAAAVGVGVGEEAAFGAGRRARPAPPSAAARPAGASSCLSCGAASSAARTWRKVQPSTEAHELERLVALHHLGQQLARRGAGVDLVAAGADAARLARPAEPFVEQPRIDAARRRRPRPARPRAASCRARSRPRHGRAASGSGRSSHHHARGRAASGDAASSSPSRPRPPETLSDGRDMAADDNQRMHPAPSSNPRLPGPRPARRLGRDPRQRRRRRAVSCTAS